MKDFIVEYWEFIRERKRYVLVPLFAMLILLGFLLVFAKGSAVAPFIYTLF